MRKAFTTLILSAAICCAPAGRAAAADETVQSAQWLLKKATLIHANGMHNILLRALRQMRDPALEPLFRELAGKRHPVLKIHGILGLGEIDPSHRIDLTLVAQIMDPATQAQLVSSAIEGDLMDLDQVRQMMGWPGLDPAVKIILATRLVDQKALKDPSILDAALTSDNPAVKGTAAMLKLQLGDAAAIHRLREIDASGHPSRNAVRLMLLQTALRYQFDAIGPWAMRLSGETGGAGGAGGNDGLSYLALRTTMDFKAPGAVDAWVRRYDAATNQADRIRLAVLALDLAAELEPALFKPLMSAEAELIRRMGRAGEAIAQGGPADGPILELLKQNHLLASKWVLQHALDLPIEKAQPILIGIILAAQGEPNPPRYRAQRLEDVVFATQRLIEQVPDAQSVIASLLQRVPALTREAMIMGMIRSETENPYRLIEEIQTWPTDTAASMALVLKARQPGVQLQKDEIRELALIVRGGAGLQDPLRIQAAWAYLKQTQQHQSALADVLGERS